MGVGFMDRIPIIYSKLYVLLFIYLFLNHYALVSQINRCNITYGEG